MINGKLLGGVGACLQALRGGTDEADKAEGAVPAISSSVMASSGVSFDIVIDIVFQNSKELAAAALTTEGIETLRGDRNSQREPVTCRPRPAWYSGEPHWPPPFSPHSRLRVCLYSNNFQCHDPVHRRDVVILKSSHLQLGA